MWGLSRFLFLQCPLLQRTHVHRELMTQGCTKCLSIPEVLLLYINSLVHNKHFTLRIKYIVKKESKDPPKQFNVDIIDMISVSSYDMTRMHRHTLLGEIKSKYAHTGENLRFLCGSSISPLSQHYLKSLLSYYNPRIMGWISFLISVTQNCPPNPNPFLKHVREWGFKRHRDVMT